MKDQYDTKLMFYVEGKSQAELELIMATIISKLDPKYITKDKEKVTKYIWVSGTMQTVALHISIYIGPTFTEKTKCILHANEATEAVKKIYAETFGDSEPLVWMDMSPRLHWYRTED